MWALITAWSVVGMAGGILWSRDAFTGHGVVLRIIAGCLCGPLAFLLPSFKIN